MEETAKIVEIFAGLGIRKVRLTGGEPLIRKDVPWLVSKIKSIPAIREIVMTSNGILLGRFAKELRAAGLDRINISLDTLSRKNFERITGMDKFNEVLNGITSALEAGIKPIKINVVLMKGVNDEEVMDLVEFAIERDCEIRFIEWMPTAGEIHDMRNNRFLSNEWAKEKIQEKYALESDNTDTYAPARTFMIGGTKSKVGFISPLSNAFCANCNRLRIKANGMLKTCLHGKEDLDIKALLRQGLPREAIEEEIRSVVFDRPEEHFLNNSTVQHNDFVMTAVGG